MGRWEQRYWGRDGFPETLTALELQRFFTPTTEEMTVVTQRRSETNRIAFALQLGYLKMTGRSLNSVDLVPVRFWPTLERSSDARRRASPRYALSTGAVEPSLITKLKLRSSSAALRQASTPYGD